MANAADSFPKAAFGGIEYPYSELTIKGGLRHSIHEFPHTPGGEVEKMGRKLYTINFRVSAHDIPGSDLERLYPDLYPGRMFKLRDMFERELTDNLVIPTLGTIKAVATEWTSKFDVRVSTGEVFDLEFVEDQDQATLFALVADPGSAASMLAASDELFAQKAIKDARMSGYTLSIFQKINDAVTEVQGVFGQADAYSKVLEGKIEAVANLCSFADSTLTEMQDPVNHEVIAALKDLWLASRTLGENLIQTQQTIREYTVPKLMSISEISTAIYGSSDKSIDILQLNAINDAFAVPSGTLLRYVA